MLRNTEKSRLASSIVGVAALGILLFWGVHVFLLRWMAEHQSKLGALTETYLVPLHARFSPDWTWWAAPAVVTILVFLRVVLPFLLRASVGVMMLTAITSFVAISTSVSMIDGFQAYGEETHASIVLPFARTHLEYVGDVPLVERTGGPREFIRKYSKPRFFEQLSLHSRTHPPGGALFYWAVAHFVGAGAWTAALATIGVGSLASLLVFLIVLELYGDRAGRIALIVFLLTPNVVTYAATCADSVFAVPAMGSLYFFLRAQRPSASLSGQLTWSALYGLSLATAAFFTYAVVFLPAFFLVLMVYRKASQFHFSRMLPTHLVGLLAFASFYVALFLWAGYDPRAAISASVARDAEMVGTGHESWSTYWVISFSNLIAFGFGIGVPTLALWLRKVAFSRGEERIDAFVGSFLWSWLLMGFSTLFTLEVERVWLFLSPFVLAPVGRWLSDATTSEGDTASLRYFAAALALNTVLAEGFLDLPW